MSAVDLFRLDGKVAAVSGARGRLGSVWCEALLGAGAVVAAVDIEGAATTDGFSSLRASAHAQSLLEVEADVTSRSSLEGAAVAIESHYGPVDILVNNAGIDTPPGGGSRSFTVFDADPSDFLRTVEVNLLGAFQSAQVFGRAMAERGSGTIVNIGSLYATVSPDARLYDHLETDPPFLKPPAYGASKAALVNVTKYLAAHWGPSGVRVNALSPGGVEGGQDAEFVEKFGARVPLGRMARAEELVGPLLFLASDSSSYVTGIELLVDGGFTAW